MTPATIIARKRDSHELTESQIADFINGYVDGSVSEGQMAAMAMAIFLNGMTAEETATLTRVMLETGVVLSWSDQSPVVDKHSTGGIGDKVSLVLAPLLACCDLRVPMISGRGLGPTGGTLDKLESIAGFRCDLSIDEIRTQTDSVGCVITGATNELVPADRKLYALRDVTATVPSLPLITASIMSKKLAEGLDALVLDVKYGSGAGMKSLDDARKLAQSMVDVGKLMGLNTSAFLTNMHEPLGRMVGNTVEVNECVATLQGQGPADLRELTLGLASDLLLSIGKESDENAAREGLARLLDSGKAYETFAEMVQAQGGDIDATRPLAPQTEIVAEESGYVEFIDGEKLGVAVIELGGGRKFPNDRLDHSTGVETLVNNAEKVTRGQPLFRVFAEPEQVDAIRPLLSAAVGIRDECPTERSLIAERLG
ncbi:MAG: thymidine phosphorylase [Planctomycetaceae bacterium]|nr:thymidine phosphorylase [Planctomycetaceae bacterium]